MAVEKNITKLTLSDINNIITRLNNEIARRDTNITSMSLLSKDSTVSHNTSQGLFNKISDVSKVKRKRDRTGIVKCTEVGKLPSGYNSKDIKSQLGKDMVTYADHYNLLLTNITALNNMTPCVESQTKGCNYSSCRCDTVCGQCCDGDGCSDSSCCDSHDTGCQCEHTCDELACDSDTCGDCIDSCGCQHSGCSDSCCDSNCSDCDQSCSCNGDRSRCDCNKVCVEFSK